MENENNNSKFEPKKRYYTPEEKVLMSIQLADLHIELSQLNASKKVKVDEFNSMIKTTENRIANLVTEIHDGYEIIRPEQTEITPPDPGEGEGGGNG